MWTIRETISCEHNAATGFIKLGMNHKYDFMTVSRVSHVMAMRDCLQIFFACGALTCYYFAIMELSKIIHHCNTYIDIRSISPLRSGTLGARGRRRRPMDGPDGLGAPDAKYPAARKLGLIIDEYMILFS